MQTTNPLPDELNQVAKKLTDCYSILAKKNSNVVRELLKKEQEFHHWDHYPKGDVLDKRTHCQYYYHSHPSADHERLKEHGHFHVFIRQPALPKHHHPIYVSRNYAKNKSDNLCHLFGINMNEFGLPIGFFTVNHWVAGGIWYPSELTSEFLDLFELNEKPAQLVNCWLNAMVQLFNAELKNLILKRDEVIKEWLQKNPSENVFTDKRLEITSYISLSD